MENSKTYYGMTYFDKNELKEATTNHRIELEYYKIKEDTEDKVKYGIEILKKEYVGNNITEEQNNIKNISDSSEKVIEIINTLKKYKVTPVGLNDVLEDLLKQFKN